MQRLQGECTRRLNNRGSRGPTSHQEAGDVFSPRGQDRVGLSLTCHIACHIVSLGTVLFSGVRVCQGALLWGPWFPRDAFLWFGERVDSSVL